jgi:hypothetical protein
LASAEPGAHDRHSSAPGVVSPKRPLGHVAHKLVVPDRLKFGPEKPAITNVFTGHDTQLEK